MVKMRKRIKRIHRNNKIHVKKKYLIFKIINLEKLILKDKEGINFENEV